MLAKHEKLLLSIMGAVAAASAVVIAVTMGAERLQRANAKTRQYQAQILTLEKSLRSETELAAVRTRLTDELAAARKKFYSKGEISPFTFGTMLRRKLAAHGVAVTRYQVIEQKGVSSLEFSVSAPVGSLILFLKDASESERYWNISSLALSMKEGIATADAVFRIGYEVLNF